ncbi:hypothetical protein [Halomarina litorea]|uniref:hypothetical protein n=1 Tax=Halomarina litorea TaxID=2961595 RepID=UPI0020C2DD4A|nr:hypothetical protein [Halomarina sp. BCD28]
MVAPFDHFRADEGAPVAPGIYRVVGADDERVTLLHVGDTAGGRVHTGRIERVPRTALDRLEAADSPDLTGPRAALAGGLEGLWLTARFAPRRAAKRPLQTVAGLVLYLGGLLGPSVATLPDPAFDLAQAAGVLLLAAAVAGLPRGR